MELTIYQPLGYSQQGGRANNEDNIFPAAGKATPDQKWFMVCDGVGGMSWGEIASAVAVEGFNDYFLNHPQTIATPAYIGQALADVQTKFDNQLTSRPEAKGMATTFTLLYLHQAGVTVAHIGDSRVYHLRDGKIIWRTQDHSFVNELLKAGVITPQEAKTHPKRNVIDRAIQGSERPVLPDVQILNDVRSGDYFFLCTDGVLEQVTDAFLESVLSESISNEQKQQKLIAQSIGQTKDNFSAYLIQIETVQGEVSSEYRVPSPALYVPDYNDTSDDEDVAVISMSASPSPRTAPPVRPPMPVLPTSKPDNSPPPAFSAPKPANSQPTPSSKMAVWQSLLYALVVTGLLAAAWLLFGPDKDAAVPSSDAKSPNKHSRKNNEGISPGNSGTGDTKEAIDKVDDALNKTQDLAEAMDNNRKPSADEPIKLVADKLFKKKVDDGWVLVDENNNTINHNVYQNIKKPGKDSGIMAVQASGTNKWGYIDSEGKEIIDCRFDQAEDFKGDKAKVREGKDTYDIDKTGKRLNSSQAGPSSAKPSKQTGAQPSDHQ
ncbi:protein phosphatase 2C domain-containing protein [Spirosoma aerolatum]|uniref:protein phosphatase 2C domain-containing protein n=1 Tax=Spirosoma aerolatum TaxID=1211326 RepID=UPI0009AC8100|nr:protein phosphatase 2C domain-containing protein [Spirosoma aerolatum]